MKKQFQAIAFLIIGVAAGAGENPPESSARVYRQSNAWVQEVNGVLTAARTLRITTDAGSVKIRAAAQPNITYVLKKRVYNCVSDSDAQKYLSQFKITAWQQGDSAVLRGQCEFCGNRKHGSMDFDIVVPKDTALVNINTEGGDISVTGISGRMEAETGGGNIQADEVGGLVRVTSGGGNIDIGRTGGDLRLETGGGNVRVLSAKGRIDAQSGGGNITIDSGQGMALETGGGTINISNANGDLRATTGGGNITVGSVAGLAVLETGGGSIRLSSANGPVSAQSGGGSIELFKLRQGAQAETGGGGIVAEFISLAGGRESHLETSAGDIVVYLADDLKATVNAAIDVGNGHAIQTDFSTIKVTTEGDEMGGMQEFYANGSLNGGGPYLKLHTTVGNIELRKRTLAQR